MILQNKNRSTIRYRMINKNILRGRRKMKIKIQCDSFHIIICLIIIFDRQWCCRSESFFGKIRRLATGGGLDEEEEIKERDDGGIPPLLHGDGLNHVPSAKLSNGIAIPLIGLGAGSIEPELVSAIISQGLKDDKNIRLIDTSIISHNEFLVAKGIVDGVEWLIANIKNNNQRVETSSSSSRIEVHVVSKVWYTHLGYNRTLLAVKSSLESLQEATNHPNVDLKIHMMLHWPRCYDTIPWMDCIGEENNVSEEMKNAGPSPHLNKEDAWKESWTALEGLVVDNSNPIASIGVSNFHLKELEELSRIAKVTPHIVETNTWSLLYDPLLIEFCHKRGIHLIAYHLMEGVIRKADSAPFAYHHLLSIANDVTNKMRSTGLLSSSEGSSDNTDSEQVSPAQVVLSWLVQHSISVIPRTTDLNHLNENSASSISKIPTLGDTQVQIVAHSVEALISGEDLTEDAFVKLTFHAKTKDIYLYWHDPEFGGEIEVAKIEKGTSFEESSHPGHVFRIYDSPENTDAMELFTVSGNYGEHRHIEL